MALRNKFFYLTFVMCCALVSALTNFGGVGLVNAEGSASFIRSIVTHTASSPYQYRILAPYFINGVSDLLHLEGSAGLAAGLLIFWAFSYLIMFIAIFQVLRIWFSAFTAQIGILIMCVSIQVTFDGTLQPWTVLEAGLFALALIAIYRRLNFALLVILIVASFNRETSCFIILFYLINEIQLHKPYITMKALAWTGIYLVAWLAIFIGLRISLGATQPEITLQEIFKYNLTAGSLAEFLIRVFLFLGAYWILVFKGFKSAPLFIKKAWFVVPVYLAFVIVFGIWSEVRLFMPLYSILIPTILASLSSFFAGEKI